MSEVFQCHPIRGFTEFSWKVITVSVRYKGKRKKREKTLFIVNCSMVNSGNKEEREVSNKVVTARSRKGVGINCRQFFSAVVGEGAG